MTANDEEVGKFFGLCNSIGSKVIGGVGGFVATTAFGSPIAGIAVAPFLAIQLERAGKELIDRQLGPRQRERVAATYVMALQLIQEAIENGASLRKDDFFTGDGTSRSAAEELTEATLMTAMTSHEENKIPFIAQLLRAVFTEYSIDKSSANTMLAVLNELRYRSIVLMHFIENRDTPTSQEAGVPLYLLPN